MSVILTVALIIILSPVIVVVGIAIIGAIAGCIIAGERDQEEGLE